MNSIGKFDNVRLHIEYVDVNRLLGGYRRTNRHSARQVKKLASAIERDGFNVPILVDDELNIVAGHARADAAKVLGLVNVPTIRLAHLTPEQLRLFKIFDNKIATESELVLDSVRLELEELVLISSDLSLTDSGFEFAEIDAMNGLHRTNELDDLDEVPEPAANPVTRLGDLWRLGEHRLICGDSTDQPNIDAVVGGRAVRALVVDAPYNLKIPGVVSGKGRIKHDNFEMASGEMSRTEFTTFLFSFFEAAKPSLINGAMILAFMDWRHIVELIAAGGQSGFAYRQLLVWEKSSPAMGALWRNSHELIGAFKHGDAPHVDNIQLGKFGRNRSNVLHYPGANVPTKGRRRALETHPTVKPAALIADLILDVTNPGDLVLDSFGGSGTTLMAANAVGRLTALCEISPGYVDATIDRWARKTGEMAILDATGETWPEVRDRRADEEAIDA